MVTTNRSWTRPGGQTVLPRTMNHREWSEWLRRLMPAAKTFTPDWQGFAVAPTGDLRYANLFGVFAVIWAESEITGTAAAVTEWLILDVPEEIWPTSAVFSRTIAIDDGYTVGALARVNVAGSIRMYRESTGTAPVVQFQDAGWTISAEWGLPAGAAILYPL